MRPPRPSTAARSPAPRARDTGPFLWEGQAIAPLPRPVLPGWACTPVLLCSVFTKCPFLSSPTPVDPPIARRPSAVTRDLTRPFFLNDTRGQVRNRPSCVQSARAREPPVEEAWKGRGLPSGSPPGACGCLPPAGTSAACPLLRATGAGDSYQTPLRGTPGMLTPVPASIHTHTHLYLHPYIYIHTPGHVHTNTPVLHTYTPVHVHTHLYTHMCFTCTYTPVCVYTHLCLQTHIYMYVHSWACTHTCARTNMCMYIHTCSCIGVWTLTTFPGGLPLGRGSRAPHIPHTTGPRAARGLCPRLAWPAGLVTSLFPCRLAV